MHSFIKRLLLQELVSHIINDFLAKSICNQELLKVKWIHVTHLNASHGNRHRLRQSHPKQRATGDISVAVLGLQEFEHGQQMRIGLNLVKKHQSLAPLTQAATSNSAKT